MMKSSVSTFSRNGKGGIGGWLLGAWLLAFAFGANGQLFSATVQAGDRATSEVGERAISIGTQPAATSAPSPSDSAPAPPEKIKDRRHAVIIGINEYQKPDLNLRFCKPDALLMYDILTDPERGGIPRENTRLLLDAEASRSNIELAFDDLITNAHPDDMVFVYYSGHGAPGDNNLFFWVTHDANIDRLRVTSLSNDRIAEFLHDVRSNRMVQFLDCCYSLGTVAGRTGPVPMPSGDPFGSLVSQGRVTFTATSGKEKAIELSSLGHGAFTYYLAEGLRGNADTNLDGWVDVDEAWAYLNNKVTREAEKQGMPQHPYRFGASTFGLRLTRDPASGERLGPLESGLQLLLGDKQITRIEYNECIRILSGGAGDAPEEHRATLDLARGELTPEQWRRVIARRRTGSETLPTSAASDGTPPPPPTPPPPTPSPIPTLTPTPLPTPAIVMDSPWSRMGDRERLKVLTRAIEKYHQDTQSVPESSSNWFRALVENPAVAGWNGPYLSISATHPPIDRFNTPLVYETRTVRLPGRPPTLKIRVISCGADGIFDHGSKNDLMEEISLRGGTR
jgi:hypothetical protein